VRLVLAEILSTLKKHKKDEDFSLRGSPNVIEVDTFQQTEIPSDQRESWERKANEDSDPYP
jgi:uncharacterized protein YejL (UPF0352 family)